MDTEHRQVFCLRILPSPMDKQFSHM